MTPKELTPKVLSAVIVAVIVAVIDYFLLGARTSGVRTRYKD